MCAASRVPQKPDSRKTLRQNLALCGASQICINTSVSYMSDTACLNTYNNIYKKRIGFQNQSASRSKEHSLHPPLFKFHKILFPPLRIKLELIENILKVINKKNGPSVSNK